MASSGDLKGLFYEAQRASGLTLEELTAADKKHPGRKTTARFLEKKLERNVENFRAVELGVGLRFEFILVKLDSDTPESNLPQDVQDIIRRKSGTFSAAARLIEPHWRQSHEHKEMSQLARAGACRGRLLIWLRRTRADYNLIWLEWLFRLTGYRLTVSAVAGEGEKSQRVASTLDQLFEIAMQQAPGTEAGRQALLKEWGLRSGIVSNIATFKLIERALNTTYAFAMEPSTDPCAIAEFLEEAKKVITWRHKANGVSYLVGKVKRGKPYSYTWLFDWIKQLRWVAQVFFSLGYRLMIWETSENWADLQGLLSADGNSQPDPHLQSPTEKALATDFDEGASVAVTATPRSSAAEKLLSTVERLAPSIPDQYDRRASWDAILRASQRVNGVGAQQMLVMAQTAHDEKDYQLAWALATMVGIFTREGGSETSAAAPLTIIGGVT